MYVYAFIQLRAKGELDEFAIGLFSSFPKDLLWCLQLDFLLFLLTLTFDGSSTFL
jgi:hypothetical protein